MKEFKIFAGLKDDNEIGLIGIFQFNNITEAMDSARDFAKSLYCQNPTSDVLDIMKSNKVDEDEAFKIFFKQMYESIEYNAVEVGV